MCLNCENSYFAGFFDGEGHVMIRAYHRGTRSMSLVVTVGNIVREPLERAQLKWGGRIFGYQNPNRKRIVWRWTISSKQASIFLKDIWPHVSVKRGQVVAALEFQDRVDSYQGPHKRTDEEMAERNRLRDVIRSLNSRNYNGIYQELKPVGGGCLNCGCGEISNTHGDPLNITLGRLRLIAQRNKSTMKDQAVNILATIEGEIKKTKPRGSDEITVKLTRHVVKPKMEARYVERSRLVRPKKEA